MFMTAVTVTYIFFAPEGCGLLSENLFGILPSYEFALAIGLSVTLLFTFMFMRFVRATRENIKLAD